METRVERPPLAGCGVLYTAVGGKYVRQAMLSAQSLKRQTPGLHVTLFTDDAEHARRCAAFDAVEPITPIPSPPEQYMLDRLMVLSRSPYERTLALDTDTYVLDDIAELFRVLDRFDVALCHAHRRAQRYRDQMRDGKALAEIPYAFAPVQGGVQLYRRTPAVGRYLADLVELYRAKAYYDDQVSMRELLWKSDLHLYVLPPEYNLHSLDDLKQWAAGHFARGIPKIYHYTMRKDDDVEGRLAPFLKLLVAVKAGLAAQPKETPGWAPLSGPGSPR